MATMNELRKYLNYEFSTGGITGEDYKEFERKYIKYLKKVAKENNWEVVKASKNHYCFTAFFKRNDKFVYFSISDVRFFVNDWFYNILIRTAKSETDYTGGQNYYTTLQNLPNTLEKLAGGIVWI